MEWIVWKFTPCYLSHVVFHFRCDFSTTLSDFKFYRKQTFLHYWHIHHIYLFWKIILLHETSPRMINLSFFMTEILFLTTFTREKLGLRLGLITRKTDQKTLSYFIILLFQFYKFSQSFTTISFFRKSFS